MEIAIAMILIVIYTEFREYRWREHMKTMDEHCKKLRMGGHHIARRVDKLSDAVKNASDAVKALADKADQQSEFITKASNDLETLIKEYEINGVPLGYDRSGGKAPQFYEV
jgi:methyl-accepting chemotaxis protein